MQGAERESSENKQTERTNIDGHMNHIEEDIDAGKTTALNAPPDTYADNLDYDFRTLLSD